jgi:hypothetical protein
MVKYKRGFTAKTLHPPEQRPPRIKGGVYNDFYPERVRSAVMPPPTGDTQEPRLSKRLLKPTAKGRKAR